MTHPNELLSAHLDGELSADELVSVTDHLYECASCRRELEELAEIRSAVRALPVVEAPIPLLPAVRTRRTWVAAASSIAAAAFAIGLVITPSSTPQLDLDSMAGQHNARAVVDPGISSIRGPVTGP
jgi:anti-sigma factor RsiW